MRAPFKSTCAPLVAPCFPLCIRSLALNLAAYRIHELYLDYIKSAAKDFEEESMFSNRPKTLLYLQNRKAQISISSVSQTKELITGTGNRDQVLLATPIGLFSNLPGPLPITSCVKTYETCEVELWWLLLLADIFRRQNVEVQCLRGSFAFA